MIKTEKIIINGKSFIKTYSDKGYKVERDGVRYGEAIDPEEFNRQYTETDELSESEEISDTEALNILLGITHENIKYKGGD